MSISWLLGKYAKNNYFLDWLYLADAAGDDSTGHEFLEAIVNVSSNPSAACASDDGFDYSPLNLESYEGTDDGPSAAAEASRGEQQHESPAQAQHAAQHPLAPTGDDSNVAIAAASAEVAVASAEDGHVERTNHRGADAATAPTIAQQQQQQHPNAGSPARNGLLQAEPVTDTDKLADTDMGEADGHAGSAMEAELLGVGADSHAHRSAHSSKRGSSTQELLHPHPPQQQQQDSRKRHCKESTASRPQDQHTEAEATTHSARSKHGAVADALSADTAGADGELGTAEAAADTAVPTAPESGAAAPHPSAAAADAPRSADAPAPAPAAAVKSSPAFKLLSTFLSKQEHAQEMLLPSPTNLSPLFVAGPQLLGVVSVMQWAVQHLPALGHVPLLEGCAVCVPAQDIADHLPPCSSVPPVSRPTGIFRQLTEIPGLGVSSSFSSFNNFSSSSRAGVSSSSSASIPWRLRQVAAVELPRHARAAADDVVLVLVGGGRVRAGAVAGVPLAEVAGHEFLCCELLVLPAASGAAPLTVCDVASAVWRLHLAAALQTHIESSEQNVAQLRAKGFDDDVVTSQVQAAHTGAGATLKRLPGINWLKEEVLPTLELSPPSVDATDPSLQQQCFSSDPGQLRAHAAAAWANYVAHMQQHPHLLQQQWSEAAAASSPPFTAPLKRLGLGPAEAQLQEPEQEQLQGQEPQQPNGFHAPATAHAVAGASADAAEDAPAADAWGTSAQLLPPSAFELVAAGAYGLSSAAGAAEAGQPMQVDKPLEQEQQAEPMLDNWQQQQEALRQQQQQQAQLQQQQLQEQLLQQQQQEQLRQQQEQQEQLRQQQQQQHEQLQQEEALRQQQQQQQEQLRLQQQQEEKLRLQQLEQEQLRQQQLQQEQLRQQQEQEQLRLQQQRQQQPEPEHRFSLGLDGFDDGLGFLSHAEASRDIAGADNRPQLQHNMPLGHQLGQQPASRSFGAAAAVGGGGGGSLSLFDEGDDFGFAFSRPGGPQPPAAAATQQPAVQPAGANIDNHELPGAFAEQPSTVLQPAAGGSGLQGTASHPVGAQGAGMSTLAHRVSSRYGSMFGGHASTSSAAGSGAAKAAAAGMGGTDMPDSPSAVNASDTAGKEAVSHDDIYRSFGLSRASNKAGANLGLPAGLARARQGADDALTSWLETLEHTSAVAAQKQQQSRRPWQRDASARAGGGLAQPAASSSPGRQASGSSHADAEVPPPPPPPAEPAPAVPPPPPPPPPEEV